MPIVPQLAESKMDMIKSIPVHMDYVGQGRAEKLYQVNLEMLNQLRSQQFDNKKNSTNDSFPYPQIIIVLFGVVGLGWGYTIQQFSQTVRL